MKRTNGRVEIINCRKRDITDGIHKVVLRLTCDGEKVTFIRSFRKRPRGREKADDEWHRNRSPRHVTRTKIDRLREKDRRDRERKGVRECDTFGFASLRFLFFFFFFSLGYSVRKWPDVRRGKRSTRITLGTERREISRERDVCEKRRKEEKGEDRADTCTR